MMIDWLNSKSNEKCCICFSTNHYNKNCPDRLTGSDIFPPKIDRDLLPRFLELLKSDEKYYMVFSYPPIFNSIQLKPLKVFYRNVLGFPNNVKFSLSDLVFVETVMVSEDRIGRFPSNNSVKFIVENLEIQSPNLSSKEFLLLLSLRTKKLICSSVNFSPKATFHEVIDAAPNLEILDLCQTNVAIDWTWPDILLQYSKENNLKIIYLRIPNLNFNVENLAALMKQKSSKPFVFHFYIYVPESEYSAKIKAYEKEEEKKFSKYFTAVNYDSQQCFKLCYTCDINDYDTLKYQDPFMYQNYGLKKNCDNL